MLKKQTSVLLAVLVAGAALLATPLLFAAGKGLGMGEHHGFAMHSESRHGGHGRAMAALLDNLDLTREQKESLHAIF
ncbi:MAG TPA: hypothetical protein VLV48_05940, partial [Thermoanaerobaculia bacterium]|nr:hypothetical protein [Thermoanaerobaculia bacterium]